MNRQGLYRYKNYWPRIAENVFIAPGARIIGRVEIGEAASVWFNTVIRGDVNEVKIGPYTNIQDGCTLHEEDDAPLTIGERVTIGHNAIIHGCTIGKGALIGMGAIILNKAVVGENAVVAAGSLVVQGQEIPPGHLAMGSPAKIIRALTPEESKEFQRAAENYRRRAREYSENTPEP
ncbi:MAG: gamma carbonic anhydrase family protein [Bacillota bacterium]